MEPSEHGSSPETARENTRKAGLITLSLERERVDLARSFGERGARRLRDAGCEVITPPDLVFTTGQCVDAAADLQARGARCIIIQLGTWVFTPAVVDTVRALDIPFGIWAEDNPQSFSLTAGGIVHGSLDEMGIRHRFFYGSPESGELIGELVSFVNAASAAHTLRTGRLCMVGGRVMGMYTTMADIVQLKEHFGVEVEHMDAVRLYLAAENAPAGEVSRTRKWIADTLGSVALPEDMLERSIRLYLAMRGALEQEGYRIAAVKCQDEMINQYASSCLAVSLLNDQGITVSCETDLNAALTMQLLRSLSGGAALFGDVNHLDLDSKVLRVVNCGSMPTLMASSREEVDLGRQYEYMGKAGGATTVLTVKESPVTLARLSRVKGRFVMLAAEGSTQQVDRSRLQEARENWPQAFVKLDGDMSRLIQNLRSNHMHLCFGKVLKDLKEFCIMKDIELITI
ncbi:MAG: L-fucose/L-arabinose isomerase family protein [Spirochaetota bacterium]